MTNDDAIKWLENLKQDIGQLRHENLWPYAQAIDEICGLLEEQEPVKPVKTWNTYLCGNCNRNVYHEERQGCLVLYEERYTYCPNCGKRLDWNARQREGYQRIGRNRNYALTGC